MEIKKVIKQVEIPKYVYEEREVNIYVTKDGKEFTDEISALHHEKNLKYKKNRKNYDNIERFYVGDIPNYDSLEISIVKNQEEVEAILAVDNNVKGWNDFNSMSFPNMIIISSQFDEDRDRFYHFETIKDIIEEWQPFVDFYNKMLELKKEYELGDNQYG